MGCVLFQRYTQQLTRKYIHKYMFVHRYNNIHQTKYINQREHT